MSNCFSSFGQCIQKCEDKGNSVESLLCGWDCQMELANCISSTLKVSIAEALDMTHETLLVIQATYPRTAPRTSSGGAAVLPLPVRRPTPTPSPSPTPDPSPGSGKI